MRPIKVCCLLALCLAIGAWPVHAEINSKLLKEIKMNSAPVALEVSLSGQRIFVLDDRGNLLIYNMAGQLTDSVPVGKEVNAIKVSPRDDMLFLSSRSNKSVQILNLTFTKVINTSGSPFQGPSNAPVAIVVFSDFQCPYCARVGPIIEQVRKQYPKEVKSVFKHFPLASHKYAMLAAKASIAADAQGKFWEFHDRLFQEFSQLNEEKIEEIRASLGLDKAKFDKVVEAPQTLDKITKDVQEAESAEVRGTPTVFVNGRMVRPVSYESLKEAVDEVLKPAEKK